MALTHPTTKEVLTYNQAKQHKIDSRVAKRPRPDNMDSVDAQDFEIFKKGEYSFSIAKSPVGREFMQLNLPIGTSMVRFSLKLYCLIIFHWVLIHFTRLFFFF